MTQRAGQLLPWGHSAAVSRQWVTANGRVYQRARAHDYHRRYGFLRAAGIYLMRVPRGPTTGNGRWLVLLRDDPTQPDLPADTPTIRNPPTASAATIVISSPTGGTQTSPVAITGVCTAGIQLQAASNTGGVIGGFTALTVTGTSFSGAVTMAPGAALRIRVRQVGATYNYVDSNAFTVSAAAGDPDEPPQRPQLPQRPKRG